MRWKIQYLQSIRGRSLEKQLQIDQVAIRLYNRSSNCGLSRSTVEEIRRYFAIIASATSTCIYIDLGVLS